MKQVLLATICVLTVSTAFGQTIVQPRIYTQPTIRALVATPPTTSSEAETFSNADFTAPTSTKSQFGVSSSVYSLSIYGIPKCTSDGTQDTCVSTTWLKLSVNSNVISSVSKDVAAIREYVLSQKGSPLSISLPVHPLTTKKGDVRQTWFAFSPYGSVRFIPITGSTGTLSGGGSLSAGATGEAHFEFDATEPGSAGSETVYPGTLYVSFTPTIAATLGNSLKSEIFNGATTGNSMTWGAEYRVGFEFKGAKPISLGITGTYSAKGFTSAHTGIGISLSKMLGSSK